MSNTKIVHRDRNTPFQRSTAARHTFVLRRFRVRVLELEGGPTTWIAFGIGAVLGILLIALLFDWAIILLSALYGAFLIGSFSPLGTAGTLLLIGSTFVFGVTGQIILLYSERRALGRVG